MSMAELVIPRILFVYYLLHLNLFMIFLFLMGKSDLVNICTLMVCTANLVLLSFQFLQFLAKQKHHKYHAAIISSKVLWLLISFSNDPKLIVVKNDRRQWLDIFHENKWTINSSTTKQTDRSTERQIERKRENRYTTSETYKFKFREREGLTKE